MIFLFPFFLFIFQAKMCKIARTRSWHHYLHRLVHGGGQEQVTELGHWTPVDGVDRAPVALQTPQGPPGNARAAGLVQQVRLDPLAHL